MDPVERLPRREAAGRGHRHQFCRKGCSNRRSGSVAHIYR